MRTFQISDGFVRELHFAHHGGTLLAAWGTSLHAKGLKWLDLTGSAEPREDHVPYGEMALDGDLSLMVEFNMDLKRRPMVHSLDVLRLTDRELLQRLPLRLHLTCMAFSPDTELLLVAGADYTPMEPVYEVDRWLWKNANDLPPLTVPSRVVSMNMTRDRKLLVTGGDDNAVRVWRNDTGTLMDEWRHKATVRRLLFADRDRLLVAAAGCSVALWDMEARRQQARLRPHRKQVNDIALSPDGRLLATASSDGTIRLLDLRSASELRSFAFGIGKVGSVAFAPDGLTMAAGGEDGQIVLWDVDA